MTSPVLNTTARQIIESAFRAAGITPQRQAIKDYETERGLETLNFIIKHWQAQDIHLWSKAEAVIPLITGQRKYSIGPNGDEISDADNFFFTNIEVDQIATDTVLSIFDTTGMVEPSRILSFSPTDATQDWTAINSATLASDGEKLTVTNGAAVAGGAEYTLETTTGQEYIIDFDYELGTSAGCTFSAVSGAVLDTATLVASSSDQLRFVANSDTVTFRAENVSAVSGEDSTFLNLFYVDIATGSRIGVQLDDDTRQWSNIIDINTAVMPALVTVSEALTDDAAAANIVYSYTAEIARPLRILQTRYGSSVTASEIPTDQWSRSEYFDQPDKDSKGTVVQWYYSPQLTNGDLYVWQTAASVNNVLRFTYTRPLDISINMIDAPDIPSEWVNPLKWNLAKELAVEFNQPQGVYDRLNERAINTLDLALAYDEERDSMTIVPDYTGS